MAGIAFSHRSLAGCRCWRSGGRLASHRPSRRRRGSNPPAQHRGRLWAEPHSRPAQRRGAASEVLTGREENTFETLKRVSFEHHLTKAGRLPGQRVGRRRRAALPRRRQVDHAHAQDVRAEGDHGWRQPVVKRHLRGNGVSLLSFRARDDGRARASTATVYLLFAKQLRDSGLPADVLAGKLKKDISISSIKLFSPL